MEPIEEEEEGRRVRGAGGTPTTQAPPTGTTAPTAAELINRAAQDLSDYQRLTAEGKLGEAGQKLDELKRTLDELQKTKP